MFGVRLTRVAESQKRLLEQANEELAACKDRILELEKSHDRAILDKARLVLEHHKQLSGIRKARQALLDAQIVLLEAESELGVLKELNADITKKLDEGKQNLERIKTELSELRDTAAEAREQAVSVLTEENREELGEKAQTTTLEEVDQAVQVEKAKLEVIQASNPAALEEYERYAARIERERANQANQESKLAELNERIHSLMSQWEPKLDELVSQINEAFSYNFEQISCAGEVGVHKDEDFEKWSIEIKVKFR